MKILSNTKRSEFVFAPYSDSKIISPIKIKNSIIEGGIKINYNQLYYAQKLKRQMGMIDDETYSTRIIGCQTSYDEYILDPISLYIQQFGVPSKKIDFEGIVEYNPRDNSSFWWEVQEDINGYEIQSSAKIFTESHRVFGISLDPGFIVVIGDKQQKLLILTLMGSENNIIGRSRKHPKVLRQFEFIQRLWPELDISSEISSLNPYITYKFNPPEQPSEEARIICAIKDTADDTIYIGETHAPNNTIIEQFGLK